MKKIYTLFVALIITGSLMAQTPQSFKYQAVVRDASGDVVVNEQVNFQLSIIEGSALGTAVYIEQHTDTTNQFGLINLVIGNGSVLLGDFASVDWGNNNYFLKVELNGVHIGTSQLLSVPYALHAKTAEIISGTITETDPVYSGSQAANITAGDITNLDNLSGTNTGDQDLSSLATKTALGDSTTLVRSEIPDVSGFIKSESDPVYGSSIAAGITGTDTTNWNNKLDSYTETQNLADVLGLSNDGNALQIKNISNPTDAKDAATKAYVDILLERIEHLESMAGVEDPVTDIEGNTYHAIRIGDQVWMAENLKTTKYNDGTDIPLVTENTAWSNLTSPGYCWYNNDEATYGDTYGALYNWYTVNTGNLCPTGWHVPTDAEWTTLTDYLGGESVAGGKLKETGTTHWFSPNTGATNETSFTALAGGFRFGDGGSTFYDVGYIGFWWSSTELSTSNAWYRHMYYPDAHVSRSYSYKKYGFSVRCLRD